ncbi:MAG TPA: class I SAM-dependent methyltransferase [Thermoleophilaceae bacterium]|nr:class I SAM-dependent methyltransferase [Thermoleophilaceae bacterium]
MSDAVADFKQGARTTWAGGDWDTVSNTIAAVGPALLDRVGIEPGMQVLDVGTGSGGTVSIPAAQRGANVTGSDLTPELFADAHTRAEKAGVEVKWVEADAEALPFEDGSFDRVLSTFGHMFAPRHEQAGAELARVCRPGGVVGTCTWATFGATAEMFKIVGGFMPPPPDFAESPLLWGDEDHIRQMLEPHGLEVEVSAEKVRIEYDTPEGYVEMFERDFGPLVMARRVLGDRWPELHEAYVEMVARENKATDGTLLLEPDYMLTVARRPA